MADTSTMLRNTTAQIMKRTATTMRMMKCTLVAVTTETTIEKGKTATMTTTIIMFFLVEDGDIGVPFVADDGGGDSDNKVDGIMSLVTTMG